MEKVKINEGKTQTRSQLANQCSQTSINDCCCIFSSRKTSCGMESLDHVHEEEEEEGEKCPIVRCCHAHRGAHYINDVAAAT